MKHTRLRTKICGVTRPGDLVALSALGPDYLGFIFYAGSVRCMLHSLSPGDLSAVPGSIRKTGVFVNEPKEAVAGFVARFGLDAVQLHGSEPPALVERLRRILDPQVQIIKAFGVDAGFDALVLNDYKQSCDLFLFDTKTPNYGGSGRRFDWNILAGAGAGVPFFLSGGIGCEELPEVLALDLPGLYGVDMNSRLEISPGVKDIQKAATALAMIGNHE